MKAEVFEHDDPAHFAPLHPAHPSSCSVTLLDAHTAHCSSHPAHLQFTNSPCTTPQFFTMWEHPCSHMVLANDACMPR